MVFAPFDFETAFEETYNSLLASSNKYKIKPVIISYTVFTKEKGVDQLKINLKTLIYGKVQKKVNAFIKHVLKTCRKEKKK